MSRAMSAAGQGPEKGSFNHNRRDQGLCARVPNESQTGKRIREAWRGPTVDVGIVPVLGLVLDVSGGDGNSTSLLLGCLVDLVVVGEGGRAVLARKVLGDSRGEGRLTVVDVLREGTTNRQAACQNRTKGGRWRGAKRPAWGRELGAPSGRGRQAVQTTFQGRLGLTPMVPMLKWGLVRA